MKEFKEAKLVSIRTKMFSFGLRAERVVRLQSQGQTQGQGPPPGPTPLCTEEGTGAGGDEVICPGSHSWEVTTRTRCRPLNANPSQHMGLTQSQFRMACQPWLLTYFRIWATAKNTHSVETRYHPVPFFRPNLAAEGRLSLKCYYRYIKIQLLPSL